MLMDVRKIWDQAPHNAFTDLLRHQGRWWCVFREGHGHESPDGALRIITSPDGATWESAGLLRSHGADLRDPKLTVTPDGRFMLGGASVRHPGTARTLQPCVWFSNDGRTWSEATPVADPDYWLWRATWHKGRCYGIGYAYQGINTVRLYQSRDGTHYDTLVENLHDQGSPNEASLVFCPDDSAWCLLRREAANGLLGIAAPPYKTWTWKDLGRQIGGPHMIRLPDDRLLAAVRLYDGHVRTALAWVDPHNGHLQEYLALPSGGDTSYAGLVWHDQMLWVSYYSSHEGKTAIYLARVKPDPIAPPPTTSRNWPSGGS